MEKQIPSGLKTTFLVHFIVALIFGLILLLIPEAWGNLIGWPIKEPAIYRLVGAAILGFGASSWWAYKETAWEKVKIVLQMEIVWPSWPLSSYCGACSSPGSQHSGGCTPS